MNRFSRLLPSALTTRVFALYSITLLIFVGGGLGLFLKTQYLGALESTQLTSVMLIEVVSQSVQESVIVGDFDSVRRTLNKVVQGSVLSAADFIDPSGGKRPRLDASNAGSADYALASKPFAHMRGHTGYLTFARKQ